MAPKASASSFARSADLLQRAGQLADAARAVVGGPSVQGFIVAPADVRNLTVRCDALRAALNAYDQAMIASMASTIHVSTIVIAKPKKRDRRSTSKMRSK